MSEKLQVVNVYQQWLETQDLPIIKSFHIPNLNEVAVYPWKRVGGLGTYIQLEGTEENNDSYVCEIPPAQALKPEKHFYEEVILVLSGRGATAVWHDEGQKSTFEWHAGSLFSIPLNAWHQHFNGQGNEPARFYGVTSAPVMINVIRDVDFIFNCEHKFLDRFNGQGDFFRTEGVSHPGRVWETNFVEDTRDFPLLEWKERGANGRNICFELAGGALIAHISEFPIGTYKKAHRHGPGAHVIVVTGHGYSLLWKENEERHQVPWQSGSVLVPPNQYFHQHFNTGEQPARYVAIRWGSKKYPVPWHQKGPADLDVKKGGRQIEYEDEDPAIREIFIAELSKHGVSIKM